jgi:hypothetical protein
MPCGGWLTSCLLLGFTDLFSLGGGVHRLQDDIALRQRAQRDARGWATYTVENSTDRLALEAELRTLWGQLNRVD